MSMFKIKIGDKVEQTYAESAEELIKVYTSMGVGDVEILEEVKDKPLTPIPNAFKPGSEDELTSLFNSIPSSPKPKGPISFNKPEPEKEFEFSEGGMDFKVVGGSVFKKEWIDSDGSKDTRIVNSKTNKIYVGDQYKIQITKWVKLKGE